MTIIVIIIIVILIVINSYIIIKDNDNDNDDKVMLKKDNIKNTKRYRKGKKLKKRVHVNDDS